MPLDVSPDISLDFVNIVENKTGFAPDDYHLNTLAEFMTKSPLTYFSEKIPAGYTYLAQFIDHDISLDSQGKDAPWKVTNLSKTYNQRTPDLDLETLYGINDESNPNILTREDLLKTESLLDIGRTYRTNEVNHSFENDLPRFSTSGNPKAKIADQRNDRNLLVAQTQVAFMRFHNAIARKIGGEDTSERFKDTREKTIRYYQHIILEDFLPKIVKKDVLDRLAKKDYRFIKDAMTFTFVPSEFSVAAYRMGHSMIRDFYNLNKIEKNVRLSRLFEFTGNGVTGDQSPSDLMRNNLPSEWVINWKWFFDIKGSKDEFKDEFNFGLKIDTRLAQILGKFKTQGSGRERNLAAFDLYRGKLFGLASGQAVADALGTDRNWETDIEKLLPEGLKTIFNTETPLWFYLLAEAQINEDGETLGETGSHIVAETFYRILEKSPFSVLQNPLTKIEKDLVGVAEDGEFGIVQMLQFIEDNEPGFLNPVEATQT